MPEKITVTFLGTGDPVPSIERNHTSILLRYKDENILVDCGEGTQRQFRRAGLSISKITRILITHFHGDHTFGLPGLFQSLSGTEHKKDLHIYGPKGIKEFIGKMLSLFLFHHEYRIEVHEAEGKFFETPDFYLSAEKMTHPIQCNAYSFVKKGRIKIDKGKLKKEKIKPGPWLKELKLGKDMFYSGKKYSAKKLIYEEEDKKVSFILDTSFNKNIIPFVNGSDLLICESMFNSDMEKMAGEKGHLTSKQAGEIAKKSGSKRLIITHISQRYEKEKSRILNECKKVFKNSFLAEDLKSFEV